MALPSARERLRCVSSPWLWTLALVGGAGCGGGTDGAVDLTCHPEQTRNGQATYYTSATGAGACMFDPTPNDLMIGAMNATDFAGSGACGGCVHLQGPNAEITIRIVDLCPECPAGNIDLSPDAFGQIAPLSAGRVPITWNYVPCEVSGPVVYHFKEGSNQWWTAVQVRNHRNRVAKLEYLVGGTYQEVARTDYNFFVQPSGMGPGPYVFRVTDVYGHVLDDSSIPGTAAGSTPGASQFASCTGPQ
jgi:expansin (peptidoglycan-binding protein)